MNGFLYYLIAFAVVLGVLIVVHEFGHYIVARWAGVKVLRFSVGFGKPLLCRRMGRDETEWVLAAFPLGGYVKMLDEREGEVAADELHRTFNRQPVARRIAIVAAGPLANLLLAVLLYWGVFCYGSKELRPILGTPPAASVAAGAGIVNGEVVRRVAGETVQTWQDMRWMLLKKAADSDSVELEVINAKQEIALRRIDLASIRESGWEGDAFELLGLVFYRPQIRPLIAKVSAGSAAASGGMLPGDEIVAIDELRITTWPDVVERIRKSADKRLNVEVLRDGHPVFLHVTPEGVEDRGKRVGRIGAAVGDTGASGVELTTLVRYDPWTALHKAAVETWEKSTFSFAMIGKMLTGEVSLRNLSGPVTIADYAGQSARLGIDYYIKFMALVSISLGVLNLLPIPILDGGHLLYYVIEIIKRGPVSEKTMEIGQQIGFALLLMLMAFAFYNDINRLISG